MHERLGKLDPRMEAHNVAEIRDGIAETLTTWANSLGSGEAAQAISRPSVQMSLQRYFSSDTMHPWVSQVIKADILSGQYFAGVKIGSQKWQIGNPHSDGTPVYVSMITVLIKLTERVVHELGEHPQIDN